jgi:hypothetical protein
VLTEATYRMTRQEIHDQWPAGDDRPSLTKLWRQLDSAVAAGLVQRDGKGTPQEPHRFWLHEREQEWLADPFLRGITENYEACLRAEREKPALTPDRISTPLSPCTQRESAPASPLSPCTQGEKGRG